MHWLGLCCLSLLFRFLSVAAGSNFPFSSCGPAGRFNSSMAHPGATLPPAQFSLTVTYGSEEAIPVERLFKAFGLENLAIDPNQAILPLKLPHDLPLEPSVEQFWQFRTGWETPLDEDHRFQMLLPELLYSRVWEHCFRAFPSRIVSFSGPGRVIGVEVVVLPIAMTDVVYRLWVQMNELDGIRSQLKSLQRSMDMMLHNSAVLTKTLVTVHPDLVDELHPETPGSWTAPLEEY